MMIKFIFLGVSMHNFITDTLEPHYNCVTHYKYSLVYISELGKTWFFEAENVCT